jgi:DNA mismatch repair ATPase MutS
VSSNPFLSGNVSFLFDILASPFVQNTFFFPNVRMGLHDEIYAGRSTFFIEMMETSAILKSCTSRSLVIIDELGRGTGTHDGSAIAYAALKYLVKQVSVPFFCMTDLRSLISTFSNRRNVSRSL